MILYFFIAVWTNDTLAFIGGKLYGRKKLAPGISPGKTIEGTLTGLLFASVLMMILHPLPFSDLFNLGFGLIAGIGSVFGDLAESWLKRLNAVKDSGKILPGHGGFLDRFDAAFGAVIPVLLYMLIIKGTL
jgi:phosphatidate cytidylyltransferase